MSDSRRILDSIRRLVRLLRVSDRAAQTSAGLSAAQLFVLSELGKESTLSLNELAERTRTHQSSVSVVVTRLVEAGLVSRERADDDARRLALSITRAGRTALQKAPAVAQERLIDVVEALPPADRKRFADTFEQIVRDLSDGDEQDVPMLFEDEAPRRRKPRREN